MLTLQRHAAWRCARCGPVCAALCAAGIALSLTRGAMVALVFSLAVLMFLPAFRRWAVVAHVAVVVFAVFNARGDRATHPSSR